MVDLIKEIVSGEKIRTKEHGFNLDLTYITERIIAMAFPGSGLETVYRNNINDVNVAKFLNQKHGKKFLVINLSGRTYDYEKFDRQVKEFAWEDHHSPPLELLFDACREMHKFLLQDVNNVVCVHCNAGKGRTGTLICCYLLYCGRFESSKSAMLYYRKKRFQTGGGVTQPSQIRSLKYLEKTFNDYTGLNKQIQPQVIQVEAVKMYGIPKFSSNYFRPYIELYTVRTGEMVYTTKDPNGKNKKYKTEDENKGPIEILFQNSPPVAGDILFRVYHTATLGSKLAFRFAFNSAFLNIDSENRAVLSFSLEELDPDSTKKDTRFPKSFKVEVHLKIRVIDEKDPKFYQNMSLLHREIPEWDKIYNILKDYKPVSKKESSILLFRDLDRDDVDIILDAKKENQNADSLSNDGSFSGNELNNSFGEDSDGSKNSDEEN